MMLAESRREAWRHCSDCTGCTAGTTLPTTVSQLNTMPGRTLETPGDTRAPTWWPGQTDWLTVRRRQSTPASVSLSDRYKWLLSVKWVGHGVPCRPIFTRLGGKLLLLLITNHKQCQQSQTGNIERASVNTFSLLISNSSLAHPRYGLMSTGQCRLLTIYDKIILVNSTLIVNFNLIATSMEMSRTYLRHSLTAHII